MKHSHDRRSCKWNLPTIIRENVVCMYVWYVCVYVVFLYQIFDEQYLSNPWIVFPQNFNSGHWWNEPKHENMNSKRLQVAHARGYLSRAIAFWYPSRRVPRAATQAKKWSNLKDLRRKITTGVCRIDAPLKKWAKTRMCRARSTFTSVRMSVFREIFALRGRFRSVSMSWVQIPKTWT